MYVGLQFVKALKSSLVFFEFAITLSANRYKENIKNLIIFFLNNRSNQKSYLIHLMMFFQLQRLYKVKKEI